MKKIIIIFTIIMTMVIVSCQSVTSSVGDKENETVEKNSQTDIGQAGDETSYTLLNTIDISQILSPNGKGVGRPDVIAIGNELYLVYGIIRVRNHHLIRLEADSDLNPIDSTPIELYSGTHDFSIDLRVSKANNKLWYAYEDNLFKGDVDKAHFLNAAWFSESIDLIGQQNDIATGVKTTIPSAFEVDPSAVPANPEAVDDPTPFWHNNSYYIFTRAWSGWIEEFTPNSNHHVRVFNESFEKTDDFMLDLSTIIPGKTLSQNTLIDIKGQVYLIGGFYNMRMDVEGGSYVYAIPLADDLKTAVGEKIPLLTEASEWFHKVTSARVYEGKLFICHQHYYDGYDTQNIAIFDIENNYELIKNIEVSKFKLGEGKGVGANHITFEILNDMLFVFYPESKLRIFAKIFSL